MSSQSTRDLGAWIARPNETISSPLSPTPIASWIAGSSLPSWGPVGRALELLRGALGHAMVGCEHDGRCDQGAGAESTSERMNRDDGRMTLAIGGAVDDPFVDRDRRLIVDWFDVRGTSEKSQGADEEETEHGARPPLGRRGWRCLALFAQRVPREFTGESARSDRRTRNTAGGRRPSRSGTASPTPLYGCSRRLCAKSRRDTRTRDCRREVGSRHRVPFVMSRKQSQRPVRSATSDSIRERSKGLYKIGRPVPFNARSVARSRLPPVMKTKRSA